MGAALGITILVNRRDMKYFSEKKKRSNSWGEILLMNDGTKAPGLFQM